MIDRRKIPLLVVLAVVLLTVAPAHGAPTTKQSAQASQQKIYPVSKADLAHGERQLRQMLKDRPNMAKFVNPGDSIWMWTVKQFAGEGLGQRINWSSQPFDGGESVGEHLCPPNGDAAWIRVNLRNESGIYLDGERQWSAAVFELFNIQSSNDFKDAVATASRGRLSEQAWIRKNLLLEIRAFRKRRAFYKSHWLPNLATLGLRSQHFCSETKLGSDEQLVEVEMARKGSSYRQWQSYYRKIHP